VHIDFDISNGLLIIHRNGDHLDLRVIVRNDIDAKACSATNAKISIQVPGPDGTLSGPITVVASNLELPAGMGPTTLPTEVPYDVSFNPGVFSGSLKISWEYTLHTGEPDDTGDSGSLETHIFTSKPHVAVSVTPSSSSGPAPFPVTYEYKATNDSPENPKDLPPPAVGTGIEGDHGVVVDDTCSPLTFIGGDTTVTAPPLLQEGETWTFTCMHVFDLPGTFVNHASIVGSSTRDGLPWPTDTAQSSVTALGPDLTVAKSHAGDFVAGGSGVYTITVSNSGNTTSSGAVSLKDNLPGGLTATAISPGAGWACELATLTCSRNDPLAAGASYPAVTVTVAAADDAPAQVTNTATVSGGGEGAATGNDTAADPTTIDRPPGGAAVSNAFRFGKVRRNADGSVSLVVDVPGPGVLTADDAGKAIASSARRKGGGGANLVRPARATSKAEEAVTLRLRPTRAARRAIGRGRSVKARVRVAFDPAGGSPASRVKAISFR
jgi:uncharacterized repeat protein (TIGR01451 family)